MASFPQPFPIRAEKERRTARSINHQRDPFTPLGGQATAQERHDLVLEIAAAQGKIIVWPRIGRNPSTNRLPITFCAYAGVGPMRCMRCGSMIEAKQARERLVNRADAQGRATWALFTGDKHPENLERVYLCRECARAYDRSYRAFAVAMAILIGLIILLVIFWDVLS